MSQSDSEAGAGYLEHWTREGFTGDSADVRRTQYTPDFLRADGPHAPRRLNVGDVAVSDAGIAADSAEIARTKTGVRLAVSRRTKSMSYFLRNVECDEIHFVQEGGARIRTALGTLDAGPGDFVCIPRAVTYQIAVLQGPVLTVVIESPTALRFETSRPDLLDPARDVHYAAFEASRGTGGEVELIVKAADDTTRFLLPQDPLAAAERAGGTPVWKVHLSKITPAVGSPPMPFLGTAGNDVLLYTLSARRSRRRPPIHINADYDEVIHYFSGPGAWGAVDEPGTLTWVPKGITHNGPSEDVPEGYLAWLLETRATLRLTPRALAVADLMEPGMYAKHRAPVSART